MSIVTCQGLYKASVKCKYLDKNIFLKDKVNLRKYNSHLHNYKIDLLK